MLLAFKVLCLLSPYHFKNHHHTCRTKSFLVYEKSITNSATQKLLLLHEILPVKYSFSFQQLQTQYLENATTHR